MIRNTFVLATSLLLAAAFSAAPALAGGVAGKSYRVTWIANGDTTPSDLCFRFLGSPNDDSGDFELRTLNSGGYQGRWKHLGKVNGQTFFKIRLNMPGYPRLRGLRENDGPGESIAMAGFGSTPELAWNMSIAGYRVASCSGPVDVVAESR